MGKPGILDDGDNHSLSDEVLLPPTQEEINKYEGNYAVQMVTPNTKDITYIYYILDGKSGDEDAYKMYKSMEGMYRGVYITIKGGSNENVVEVISGGLYNKKIFNISELDGYINKIKVINKLKSDGFIDCGTPLIELKKGEITILFSDITGIQISNTSNGDILAIISSSMLKKTSQELENQIYTAIKKVESKIEAQQNLHNLELEVRKNTELNEQYDKSVYLLKKNLYSKKQSDKDSFNSGFIKGTVLSMYIKWTTKVYIVKISEHKLIILTKQGDNNSYSVYDSVQEFINNR